MDGGLPATEATDLAAKVGCAVGDLGRRLEDQSYQLIFDSLEGWPTPEVQGAAAIDGVPR